jgi:hypothetical protein
MVTSQAAPTAEMGLPGAQSNQTGRVLDTAGDSGLVHMHVEQVLHCDPQATNVPAHGSSSS